MNATASSRRTLGSCSGTSSTSSSLMPKVLPPTRTPSRHITNAGKVPPTSGLPGAHVVPKATGRTGSSGTNKPALRSFSIMSSAMKIPGLASALNFIGVSNGGNYEAGSNGSGAPSSSSLAAAGTNGAGPMPNDFSSSTTSFVGDDVSLASAGSVNENTAANVAQASTSATSNGVGPVSTNGFNGYDIQTPKREDHAMADIAEPVSSSRVENNIMPYSSGASASLAVQIRDIASTLRHINALRVEYMDKIAQQEMELSLKDQALRGKEERIQALEHEAAELRRSLGQLQNARAAAEAEVLRLRAATSAAAAAPPLALPSAASASPSPAPTHAAPPAAAAVAAARATHHPLTAPPAAVASGAPAAVAPAAHPQPPAPPAAAAASAPAPAPAPAPAAAAAAAPPPPPPPPPPRVPEVVLSYRSSWPDAYLHVNVEGRGWTNPPGIRMEHLGAKEYTVRVEGRSIEFVVNNGHSEWDSPAGGGIGRNYHIDTPGEYRLHYGVLTQVKPWHP